MNTQTYKANAWTNPTVFAHYERARRFTRPSRTEIAKKVILPKIPNLGTVLEYGSGAGELRHKLLGDSLPSKITWTETDKNPNFLDLPRIYDTEKVHADLTHLPFEDETFDLVTGYGVLDTIPKEDLPGTLSELYRVCKSGGSLVEQLDLGIDLGEVFIQTEERGEVPFFLPFEIAPGFEGGQKMFFVKKVDLVDLLAFLNLSKDRQIQLKLPMITLYCENPLETHLRLEQKGLSYLLYDIAKTIRALVQIAEEEIPATEYYRRNLEHAAQGAGFEIEFSGNKNKTLFVGRNKLDEFPRDKNAFLYRNGSSHFINNEGQKSPSKVHLDTSIFVFIARKGVESTS